MAAGFAEQGRRAKRGDFNGDGRVDLSRVMRGTALAALAVLLLVAGAGSARASTVAVEPVGDNEELFYEAEEGEANELEVTTDGSTVTFEDPGAVIDSGTDCDSVSDHVATCDFGPFALVHAILRGQPDSVRISGDMTRLTADTGSGQDLAVGAALPDILDGGTGPDVLRGRGATDVVRYDGRADDLRVTLGDGERNDGGPQDGAERDRLRGIEIVVGGAGDDLLIGDGGENQVFGQDGRDELEGMGGPDDVGGGDGRDVARGGRGADLFPGGEGRDREFGGRGPDIFQGGSADNGRDLFKGQGGLDEVQYSFGQIRITIDGKANDGPCADASCASSNEGDNVTGIEVLNTSFGDDVLIGSKRDEVFHPSLGTDTVRARGGDDAVHLTIDGDPDDVNCGGGNDTIVGTPDATDMNVNCE
jgi:Ca2+-binding RTX toxin-like protein